MKLTAVKEASEKPRDTKARPANQLPARGSSPSRETTRPGHPAPFQFPRFDFYDRLLTTVDNVRA